MAKRVASPSLFTYTYTAKLRTERRVSVRQGEIEATSVESARSAAKKAHPGYSISEVKGVE